MSIPPLDGRGVLPPGLHECTLDQLSEVFGRFQTNEQRVRLTSCLREYVARVRDVELVEYLVVDGSFVTDKESPNDIDLIVVLRADADLADDFPPFVYNVISKRRVRKEYPFDVLVAADRSEAFDRHVAFFSQLRGDTETAKGLLVLRVRS